MGKTTFREKLGYGIASLGDAISYGIVGIFLLFFLTTVADIPPAPAGTIIAIGSVWNAVFNPIMGYISDNVRTRFGKRRPLIFFFAIFLSIMVLVLFTNVDMGMSVKPVYYGFLTVLFWTGYTGFFVPYYALGTDYASTYDERTSIRTFASLFSMMGTIFCMVLPSVIVAFLEDHGLTTSHAWSVTAGFLGALTLMAIMTTVVASKGRDLPCRREKGVPKKRFSLLTVFREYISVAKLKPMKYLIITSLASLISYTILMSNAIYFFTFNLGLSAVQISACLMIRSLLGMTFIPLAGRLSMKLDKKSTLIICYVIGISGMTVLRFFDLQGFGGAFLYTVFLTICTALYWLMMPAIFYDICDYDTAVTGKKREATILSFQGLLEAVAVGIGGQILGIVLQMAGFDGNAQAQTGSAMTWIENSATVLPAIFLAIAVITMSRFPLTRESDYK